MRNIEAPTSSPLSRTAATASSCCTAARRALLQCALFTDTPRRVPALPPRAVCRSSDLLPPRPRGPRVRPSSRPLTFPRLTVPALLSLLRAPLQASAPAAAAKSCCAAASVRALRQHPAAPPPFHHVQRVAPHRCSAPPPRRHTPQTLSVVAVTALPLSALVVKAHLTPARQPDGQTAKRGKVMVLSRGAHAARCRSGGAGGGCAPSRILQGHARRGRRAGAAPPRPPPVRLTWPPWPPWPPSRPPPPPPPPPLSPRRATVLGNHTRAAGQSEHCWQEVDWWQGRALAPSIA